MKNKEDVMLVSRELTVENTTYCGANCIMCPREKYHYSWKHMDTEFFKKIIDQAVKLGMQSLDACGFGDPFMDPEYRDKLAYIKEKYPHIKVYTSTTGHLIDSKRLPWVCELIDTIKISHYGFSKSVFEKIHRGSLKYEKVVKNIEELLGISKEDRPYVIMQFLIFPENEHQVKEWKNYWEPKADEVMIWLPHNYGGSLYSKYLNHPEEMRKSKPRSCGRPFKGNLFVRENGEVSMCCFDFDRQLVIGDLRRQNLRDILEWGPLRKIRVVHTKGTYDECDYICKDCDQIYPRDHALVYASSQIRKVGVLTSHHDFVNYMLADNNNTGI